MKIASSKKLITVIVAILSLLVLFFYNLIFKVDTYECETCNGKVILSEWDSEHDGIVKLDGTWEFYYKEFYYNNHFESGSVRNAMYRDVPSTWNTYRLDGEHLTRQGYGTYRLEVKTRCSAGEILSLYMGSIPSAYTLYVDDVLVATNGTAAKTAAAEVGNLRPSKAVFTAPSDSFNIIIHVSNFNFAKGGIWSDVILGSAQSVSSYQNVQIIKETILIGAFFALFLVYVCFFFNTKQFGKNLYFAIVCILAICLIDFDGQQLLFRLAENMSFGVFVRIWYIPTCWLPFFIVLYIRETFEVKKYKPIVYLMITVNAIFTAAFLLLPTKISTRLALVSNIAAMCTLAVSVVFVYMARKKHLHAAILYIFGFSVVVAAYTYDYCFYYQNITSLEIGAVFPSAIALIICLQLVILTMEYFIMQKRKEQSMQKAAAAEVAFLQAQIKPHFLYNALSAIENECHKDSDKAGRLITDLIFYLRSSFQFGNLDRFTTLESELQFIKNYIHIQQERFGDRINYQEIIEIPLTTQIPVLVLEPLVENAIRHGISKKLEGGSVCLNAELSDKGIRFEVRDNGVGMDKETLQSISGGKAAEKSVGLANISMRLRSIYNGRVSLNIESEHNKGTKVWFILPAQGGK